jgi:hypothetical protein
MLRYQLDRGPSVHLGPLSSPFSFEMCVLCSSFRRLFRPLQFAFYVGRILRRGSEFKVFEERLPRLAFVVKAEVGFAQRFPYAMARWGPGRPSSQATERLLRIASSCSTYKPALFVASGLAAFVWTAARNSVSASPCFRSLKRLFPFSIFLKTRLPCPMRLALHVTVYSRSIMWHIVVSNCNKSPVISIIICYI